MYALAYVHKRESPAAAAALLRRDLVQSLRVATELLLEEVSHQSQCRV
jgi:hypothetical protein